MTKSQASSSFALEYLSNSTDLRTPINGVIGMSKIKYIEHNGQTILYFFNNLLDASRIDTGKLNLDFQELDLIHLINTFTELPFYLFFDNREVEIQKQVPDKAPTIWADKYRMRQIITEGIRHIATLCPPEDIIKLGVDYDMSMVRLNISSENPSSFTDRNFLSDEMTSLEFFICKKLIELHDGNISIRNDDVLELTISLPIKKE